MAKSFKNLFNEVAQPKAGEEKAFKDQHVVQKFDAQPTGQDHIFTGNIEPKKRLADVMKGQDAEKYDAAYTKKVDTFQMPRNIDEEAVEELDESPMEEKEMMMGQLRAMSHYIQGIARYIRSCDDCEEWYQNKLAGVAKEMSTLYGYATSETHSMMGEAKVGDECSCCGGTITKEGTCGCGPDCEHCGGKHDISESNYVEQFIEAMIAEETKLDEETKTFKTLEDWVLAVVNAGGTVSKRANTLAASGLGRKQSATWELKKGRGSMVEEVELDEAAPKISKGKAKGSISATGLRGKGMKKFDVNVAVQNGKFEFRITDETGKFQTVGIKQAARMLGESVVDDLVNEARGTSAKYAGKSGVFGGKYTSKDRMMDMKNFSKIRDKRHKQRDAAHAEQDPKMRKMGYAKHMLDTDKADAKARKRGIDPTGQYDKYKKRNGIREELDNLEEKFKFKQSTLELNSGEKVKLSRQDAKLLTDFFGDLNPRNSKEMHKVLVTDKAGFQEILGFAREAL